MTFRHDEKIQMWLPAEMSENYRVGRSDEIRATATYTNYRRFQVSTSESLGKPAGS